MYTTALFNFLYITTDNFICNFLNVCLRIHAYLLRIYTEPNRKLCITFEISLEIGGLAKSNVLLIL